MKKILKSAVPLLIAAALLLAATPALAAPSASPLMGGGCEGAPLGAYAPFNPEVWDWETLNAAERPSFQDFLEMHGLSVDDVQEIDPLDVSWEPSMYVVEFDPELYGQVQIPLLEGFVYTLALADDSVEVMWGGDEAVPAACLQWGFTARWVADYGEGASAWLDTDNPLELVAREYRFGRYLRSIDMQGVRPDVPYFERFGPYYTGPGNVDTGGWMPPSLDSVVPASYLDACAMLGGLCNEAEWTFSEEASGGWLNWSWRYAGKVEGSGDYCPADMPCWQTAYPPDGLGYIEVWLAVGTTGPDGEPVEEAGVYRFTYVSRPVLMDGLHGVDEFSYHADPNR